MGTLLKGGNIVTATENIKADLRIENGKIVAMGYDIDKIGDTIIDVSSCHILPGGIDTHTHFDLDVGSTITADNFETGTKAAIAGGTTTILDFATQNKGETLKEALKNWHDKSKKCYCDYGFHMAITDWNENVSLEMEDMLKEGITSYKLYMAYKNILQVDDGIIFRALKRSKELGVLIGFHCENGDIIDELIKEARINGNKTPKYHPLCRPAEVEREATFRVIQLALLADAPVNIVHLSSKEALDCVLEARKRGIKVYAETCPQYLLLNSSVYEKDNFEAAKYVISPPLREVKDNIALWDALRFNEIDTIGTDHCSFNFKGQKEIGRDDFSKIPNGAPGVEHRMALMYTYGVLSGKITMNQMVALTSTNAAKIFGLYPQKGSLSIGSDADIMVWDFNKSKVISAKTHFQNVDYTAFEGYEVKGEIVHGFLRGNEVICNGNFTSDDAIGKYVFRQN